MKNILIIFLKLRGEIINNDKIQYFINNLKLNEHMKDKCNNKLPKGIKGNYV